MDYRTGILQPGTFGSMSSQREEIDERKTSVWGMEQQIEEKKKGQMFLLQLMFYLLSSETQPDDDR